MSIATLIRRLLLASIAAVVPWPCLSVVHAAEITLNTSTIAGSKAHLQTVHTLRLTGMIVPGDADKLRDILAKLPVSLVTTSDRALTVIEMSSMGGSLIDGFEIGRLFREFNVIAVVRQHDFCISSCALAFLGGSMHHAPGTYPTQCNVEIGGKIAFHNFWLNASAVRAGTSEDPVASRLQGFSDARGGAATLVKYAGEMGMQPNFVASMMGRPVEDFQYIETVGQFLSFHVCPIGLARPSIALEEQAQNICNNSTSDAETPLSLRATLIPASQVKLYLLERVQETMQSSKSKGRLAAQLANGAVMRVQQEIDRLYDDLRAAGVALPDIVGPTFEVGGPRAGNYEALCYVSLSAEDPDNYDVTIRGPKGLAEALRLPPENSRRLFLYNRNDVINPRP